MSRDLLFKSNLIISACSLECSPFTFNKVTYMIRIESIMLLLPFVFHLSYLVSFSLFPSVSWINKVLFKIIFYWDFPGGAVVKNLPTNAGDMGSIPGPGGSHMPWNN